VHGDLKNRGMMYGETSLLSCIEVFMPLTNIESDMSKELGVLDSLRILFCFEAK
jgi:hypothetical protein